jgi:predicted HTH transcriptional regulator
VLKKVILKTVVAFMNSYGGTLIIGVEDNGTVCGIEGDFETFRDRKCWDGWSQHLVNIIREHIGTEFMSFTMLLSISKVLPYMVLPHRPARPHGLIACGQTML